VLEGVEACWEPIIDRPTWEAVVAVLTSPDRRTTPGPKPRHLLSHLARCGHPSHLDDDRPVMVKGWAGGNTGPRVASYRCSAGNHMAAAQEPLDAYIEEVVVERLSRPDAAELLIARPDVDVSALAQEANSLRARMVNLGDLAESGDMSNAEYRQRKARLSEKLAGVEAEMTAAAGTSPLAGIAGRPDADEVWADLDLAHRKAVIDTLVEVVVLPAQSRGKGFDRDRVRFVPRVQGLFD
jgi:hypothetical protein